MRLRFVVVIGLFAAVLLTAWVVHRASHNSASSSSAPDGKADSSALPQRRADNDKGPTDIYAHNLMLRKGADFRVYVRWLRGQMVRTRANDDPSFDDLESFNLVIHDGVLRANIGDIANYLNSADAPKSPLTNISLSGDGDQIKIRATLHKIISLPVEINGTLSVAPGNLIQLHVTKLNVLKIPMKGLLGGFNVNVADLFKPQDTPGILVKENDIIFDTVKLLPPPHIRGQLSSVRISNPDLEEVYGDAHDVTRVDQWRNFLRLSGGTLDFGKLTMHHVDLIMIDVSNDAWFDLDLSHYQDQLVNGYTRMTPQAGMQIFMPGLDNTKSKKERQQVSLEWIRNRNLSPPADVMSH